MLQGYKSDDSKNICNNCGKYGHIYYQCKMPITSIGIIVFTHYNDNSILTDVNNKIKYLMIRRKDTLGFIEFIRGKYSIYNKEYILNLLNEMTKSEKELLRTTEFDILWNNIWSISENSHRRNNMQYNNEKTITASEMILMLYNDVSMFCNIFISN